MPDFDLAVIGDGAAGRSVAAVAAQLGLRVALAGGASAGVDGRLAGQALLAAAHAARAAGAAGRFGVRAVPEVDWAALRAHVDGVVAEGAALESAARFAALGAEVIAGAARFVGPDALAVDGRGLTARRIVVAGGGNAMPPVPGLEACGALRPAMLPGLAARPAHLVVLGDGGDAVALAQGFAALGSEVTLVAAAGLCGAEDPELVDGLRAVLAREGVMLVEGVAVIRAEAGPVLVLADGRRVSGSHLLAAGGEPPTLEGLGLAAGHVRATAAGIATDAGHRSLSNRRVFAVDGCADPVGGGPRVLAHAGGDEAGVVIRRALFRLPARVDRGVQPRVTGTVPALAQVGLTEAAARAAGHDVRVLRWPVADGVRARAERRPEGLVKLVADRRGRVLGAGILAEHAAEMLGPWTLAVARGLPVSAVADMALPYGAASEAPRRAAGSFFAPRLFAEGTKRLAGMLSRLP